MNQKIKELFIAYLEKSISPENEDLLIQWIKNNPGSLNELNDYRQIWNLSENVGKINANLIREEWNALLLKVKYKKETTGKSVSMFWYWMPRVAAVFLLGAILSFAVAYQVFNSNSNKLVYNEIDTPVGAKSKVTLPDGTVIWLNAGSTLKYSNQFNKKTREVFLTGEAFFDVEHNPSKVFLVRTSELNIKAYGTTFNVKSYTEEGTIETTLIEGSIGVTRTSFENKRTDEVMLEPNQRVVYYRKSRLVKKENIGDKNIETTPEAVARPQQKLTYLISKGINAGEFTSWKDGTLFISSETLKQLAVKLERKYNVKIHFENENLKKLKFTGSIENETIEQVIEAIGIAANITYNIKDRDVWLKEIESNE